MNTVQGFYLFIRFRHLLKVIVFLPNISVGLTISSDFTKSIFMRRLCWEGVRVCQENVVRFRSENVEFLKKMRSALGDDFNMVFDVKQAIRSGYDPFYVLNEFKNDIVHIHLSDNTPEVDCMPPGRGTFDFRRLFDVMDSVDYKGGYVIEIYSKGYNVAEELKLSKKYLENL